MSQYDNLDMLILSAVEQRRNPRYERSVNAEAQRLAHVTGREGFRIIDGRLQSLRKRGAIVHLTKAEGAGSGGWKVTSGVLGTSTAEPSLGHQTPEVCNGCGAIESRAEQAAAGVALPQTGQENKHG